VLPVAWLVSSGIDVIHPVGIPRGNIGPVAYVVFSGLIDGLNGEFNAISGGLGFLVDSRRLAMVEDNINVGRKQRYKQ
jgi:hypothetical protein